MGEDEGLRKECLNLKKPGFGTLLVHGTCSFTSGWETVRDILNIYPGRSIYETVIGGV